MNCVAALMEGEKKRAIIIHNASLVTKKQMRVRLCILREIFVFSG